MKLKFLSAILAAGALGACSVDSLVDDINEAGIDIAFDAIKQTVEAQGGAAARVKPGQEVILEVTNPSSPIAGATVKVPGDALPSDVEIASISIYHAPVQNGTNEDLVVNGNGAVVALTKLPSGEAVVPNVELTISLPITTDSKRPIDRTVLATFDLGSASSVAVLDSKGDEAKKHAVGATKELTKPFAAAWAVEYDGGAAEEETLIYKITNTGQTVCVGYRALEPANVVSAVTYDNVQYSFGLTLGFSTIVSHSWAGPEKPTPSAAVSGSVAIPSTNNFSLTCNGTVYAVNNTPAKFDLTLSEYAEASSTGTGPYVRTGSVRLKGEFDYSTGNGDRVQAAFETVKSDFSWGTLD